MVRGGAAPRFTECEGSIAYAGESQDVGPTGEPRGNPLDAIADFTEMWSVAVPADAFALAGRDEDRLLYVHRVDGRAKIAIVLLDASGSDDGPWAMDVFAICDVSEFSEVHHDPLEVWVDAAGERVPTSRLTTFPGAEHCDWEGVIYLSFEDRIYLGGDVPRELLSYLVAPPENDIALPTDSVDTGYTSGDVALWMSRDESLAYLVAPDRTNGFSLATEPVWCA